MCFSDSSLLPNHRLKFLAGDAGNPHTSSAIRAMTKMREQSAIAFIGLDNSCASEALVAAAWNYPLITYVSIRLPTPLFILDGWINNI